MGKELIMLAPVFKQMIWGGDRLGKEWGYDIPGERTGECWGISAHENGDCIVVSEPYKGKTLSQLWKEAPELFGQVNSDVFPLLIKIIDAKEDLSIQVHPDDAYAKEHEHGSLGKTECWYILECKEGATLVVGHHAKTRSEMEDMIHQNRWSEFIREVPIKKGDFIQIDPGTLHAIKGGVMLLETQQNSDITYRVYDYDRLSDGKPRPLHVKQSIDTITVPAKKVIDSVTHPVEPKTNEPQELIHNSFYTVNRLYVEGEAVLENANTFICVSVIEGEGLVDGQKIQKGSHFIIPANAGKKIFSGNMKVIYSTNGGK